MAVLVVITPVQDPRGWIENQYKLLASAGEDFELTLRLLKNAKQLEAIPIVPLKGPVRQDKPSQAIPNRPEPSDRLTV
ncbi:hypothetical protein PoB_002398500 [Plakobranchus ocellatus]|uniref:Uncharacterized protein n=1 Tax=Plakobranchus ocellatus TaxID=259542 RepID=A0AAV3ZSA7_9GAST|nr:hypothetical protein PoB_002398500 [Plakobranchus ocellatus]